MVPPVISSKAAVDQARKTVERESSASAPRLSSRIATRSSARNNSEAAVQHRQGEDESSSQAVGSSRLDEPTSSTPKKQLANTRRPANPPSAYVLFSKEARPRLQAEAGSLEGAKFNINARVKEEWLALPEEEKVKFRQGAAQRKQVWRSLMEDWTTANPEEEQPSLPEPMPPSNNAMQLFGERFLATTSAAETEIEQAWMALGEEERRRYEEQVQEAQEKYLAEKEEWEKKSAQRKRKAARKTISDDEAEYMLEVDRHGPALKTRRVDTRNTAMADLSAVAFKRGRASKRTFDMERKLKAAVKERQRILNERRAARLNGEDIEDEEPEQRNANSSQGTREHREKGAEGEEEEEEIIDEGEVSDGESLGAASEAMPPLRDNRFTVRTRIVNGQLVLDESSLQQSRSDEVDVNGIGQDFLDVNEEDRFVNSATYSKRQGTDRWDAQETQAFLKAVSMWGSDFEMISRMFATRNRKQIKAKWRSMEKLDSRSLDLAFRRKLPVDLGEYGRMAGVDLSGEAPKIEARVIEKVDEEEQQEHLDEQPAAMVELDPNGLPIIEEGGDDEPRHRPRKKSATPHRAPVKAKSKSPSVAAETDADEEDDDYGDELPTTQEAIRAAAAKSARKERATSATSNSSHRLRAGSTSGVGAAADAERLRLEKKQKEQQRKERERLRRRSVPTNEEEVL